MAPYTFPPSFNSDGLYGYIPDLLDNLAAVVPFTYNLTVVRDGQGAGRRLRGRSWSGMTGEILRNVRLHWMDYLMV